jgi:hypothetical protein
VVVGGVTVGVVDGGVTVGVVDGGVVMPGSSPAPAMPPVAGGGMLTPTPFFGGSLEHPSAPQIAPHIASAISA